MYTVSQKKLGHFYFYCNFGKCWSIFKFFQCRNQKEMTHNKKLGNFSFLLWAISFWFRHWKNLKKSTNICQSYSKNKSGPVFSDSQCTYVCKDGWMDTGTSFIRSNQRSWPKNSNNLRWNYSCTFKSKITVSSLNPTLDSGSNISAEWRPVSMLSLTMQLPVMSTASHCSMQPCRGTSITSPGTSMSE